MSPYGYGAPETRRRLQPAEVPHRRRGAPDHRDRATGPSEAQSHPASVGGVLLVRMEHPPLACASRRPGGLHPPRRASRGPERLDEQGRPAVHRDPALTAPSTARLSGLADAGEIGVEASPRRRRAIAQRQPAGSSTLRLTPCPAWPVARRYLWGS